jgi:hypothetical protein
VVSTSAKSCQLYGWWWPLTVVHAGRILLCFDLRSVQCCGMVGPCVCPAAPVGVSPLKEGVHGIAAPSEPQQQQPGSSYVFGLDVSCGDAGQPSSRR